MNVVSMLPTADLVRVMEVATVVVEERCSKFVVCTLSPRLYQQ